MSAQLSFPSHCAGRSPYLTKWSPNRTAKDNISVLYVCVGKMKVTTKPSPVLFSKKKKTLPNVFRLTQQNIV